MRAGFEDRRSNWTKAAVVVVTGLLLLSGAALASREDTIEFNRDLLRERLDEGIALLPSTISLFAPKSLAG